MDEDTFTVTVRNDNIVVRVNNGYLAGMEIELDGNHDIVAIYDNNATSSAEEEEEEDDETSQQEGFAYDFTIERVNERHIPKFNLRGYHYKIRIPQINDVNYIQAVQLLHRTLNSKFLLFCQKKFFKTPFPLCTCLYRTYLLQVF